MYEPDGGSVRSSVLPVGAGVHEVRDEVAERPARGLHLHLRLRLRIVYRTPVGAPVGVRGYPVVVVRGLRASRLPPG